MKKFAIVLAAGNGQRLGGNPPKQFTSLAGKPLVIHCLERFQEADSKIGLVVVLPKENYDHWKEWMAKLEFRVPLTYCKGGKTRTESVQQGLNQIDDEGIVAIHDAARPAVTVELIQNSYTEAEKKGSAVPVIVPRDLLLKKGDTHMEYLNKPEYLLVQTPQTFDVAGIKQAYAENAESNYTDDSEVWQRSGKEIHFISGVNQNVKATFAEDMILLEKILSK